MSKVYFRIAYLSRLWQTTCSHITITYRLDLSSPNVINTNTQYRMKLEFDLYICLELSTAENFRTLKTFKRRATLSNDLNTDSRSMKTCEGSLTELQAVKPAMSENITVTCGNKSAIGLPSKPFSVLSPPLNPCKLWITAVENKDVPFVSLFRPDSCRLRWSVALSIRRSLTVAGKRELFFRDNGHCVSLQDSLRSS